MKLGFLEKSGGQQDSALRRGAYKTHAFQLSAVQIKFDTQVGNLIEMKSWHIAGAIIYPVVQGALQGDGVAVAEHFRTSEEYQSE